MKSAVVILTLLGCDCDGVACEPIRTVSNDWASIESCQSSGEFRHRMKETAAYPLVVARCSVEQTQTDEAEGGEAGAAADSLSTEAPATSGGAGDAWGLDGVLMKAGWSQPGGNWRGMIAAGTSYSMRAVGSSLRTYAGEPALRVASRAFSRLGD